MKIGLANGCFDLLHDGHRHFLQECKTDCDYLIVAVNTDESVKRLKGKERPIDPLKVRIQKVWMTNQVDAVIPFDGEIDGLVLSIKPHIIFVGGDHNPDNVPKIWYKRGWKNLRAQGQPFMGWSEIKQIARIPNISTTEIIHAIQANAQHRSPGNAS